MVVVQTTRFSPSKLGPPIVVAAEVFRYASRLPTTVALMSKVSLVLVLLLGAGAAYVGTRPDAYHVERSTTVDAPAATVFSQDDDM